jgi:peptidyl-prolyl cis-trans isomerase D
MMSMRKTLIKIVTFGLFGLLIMSFAVWGIGDVFRGGRQITTVVEVGDIAIDQRELSRAVSLELRRLQPQFGNRLTPELARNLGLVERVLQSMINGALIDQQAADMGLVVSEARLKRAIVDEPAFRDDLGEFDRIRFLQILQNNNLSEQQYLAELRKDLSRQQISGPVVGAQTAPRALAEAIYAYQEELRTAETMLVATDQSAEPGEPDPAALETFYQGISGAFQSPEYRDVTYIRLQHEDLLDEIAPASEEELRQDYDRRRGDFQVPERRRLEQIMLQDSASAEDAMSRLQQGFAFEEVARELGSSPIDLGELGQDDLAQQMPDMAESVFKLDVGDVSAPIESDFGWHLVRVNEILPGLDPSFEEVREELAQDQLMRGAVDAMIALANQLDDELAGGASLEEAARILNLAIQQVAAVDSRGLDRSGDKLEELPSADQFAELAFNTAAGEESLLTEMPDGGFLIVRVNSITSAATRPLEEVRDQVVERWRQGERDKATLETAEALAQRVRDGETLSAVAEAEGLELQTAGPLDRLGRKAPSSVSRELAGELFQIGAGQVTVAKAPDGYLVAQLTEIQAADPGADEDTVAALQDNLASALGNDLMASFSADLSRAYGATVDQRLVDQVLASN